MHILVLIALFYDHYKINRQNKKHPENIIGPERVIKIVLIAIRILRGDAKER